MGIDDYLTAVRRHWRLIFFAVAIAVSVAWVTATVAPVRNSGVSYSATAVVLNTGSFAGTAPGTGTTTLDTVATLATLDPVVQRVAAATGFEGDPRTLTTKVKATTDEASPGILRITASSAEASEAALLANTFATELIAYLHADQKRSAEESLELVNDQVVQLSDRLSEIDRELADATSSEVTVLEAERTALTNQLGFLSGLYQQYLRESLEPPLFDIVERAAPVPVAVTGLQPPRSRTARVVIGAILGLLGGFVLAMILNRFDKRIRRADTAGRAFQAPVLAEIPRVQRNQREGLVAAEHPQSPAADALRLLGAELVQGSILGALNGGRRRESRRDEGRRLVMVTSAAPGEGKSTLVANLAVILGETGKKVLVLACDFRRPTIHRLFDVPNTVGLVDALRDSTSGTSGAILDGYVLETRYEGVSVVPSGAALRRPGEILGSGAMVRALREARRRADVVLVDTAPILAASDAAHFVPEADFILVVARAGVVTTSLAQRTHEVLTRLQAPPIGVVLNEAKETAVPRGYREYFRKTESVSDQEGEMGEFPTYRVSQGTDKV